MKIFISWSGERSKQVAELFSEWIQCVIQAVDPWLSTKDIDKGALWITDISNQLSNTNIGIVCLTNENKNKPWILFESGALAKGLSSSRVCTFLIDLEPNNVENPIAQFNHTLPTKTSVRSLVGTINSHLGEHQLKPQVIDNAFDTYWPQFEQKFKEILSLTNEVPQGKQRDKEDILGEVLATVRSFDKRLNRMEEANRPNRSIFDDVKSYETIYRGADLDQMAEKDRGMLNLVTFKKLRELEDLKAQKKLHDQNNK
jgi:hypothetical protein